MKNNKMTKEMVQERVNELHGDQAFWIIEWNGSKKPATILFGQYDPVEITIKRGEYLYRKDRKKYVNSIIFDSVQAHLDQQEKNMTLVSLGGLYDVAFAVCHCCGKQLKFTRGEMLTSKKNTCIRCKMYDEAKRKALVTEMTIQGILLTNREEELQEILSNQYCRLRAYKGTCKDHEFNVEITREVVKLYKHEINRLGMHNYFKNRFEEDLWYTMGYDEVMLCA